METHVLRWFQQVADGVTVTEVGEAEMVSQPAVSRALARLEREVGAPLLHRQGRTLRLTHAGMVFKTHVDSVIHHLDDAMAAVEQLLDPSSGTVTLVFQPSLGAWLVPDLVGSFRAQHPNVEFELRARSDETQLGLVEHPEVELELSTARPPAEEYGWRTLARETLHLMVPADHPLSGSGPVRLAEAAAAPFVMIRRSSSLHGLTRHLCEQAGFEPQQALVADDLSTLRGYVAAGLGVAVLPMMWSATDTPLTSAVSSRLIVDPGAEREIGISWSRSQRLLPVARAFTHFAVERAKAGALPRTAISAPNTP